VKTEGGHVAGSRPPALGHLVTENLLPPRYGATCTCALPPVTKGGSPEKIELNAFVG
jgi:hypothetical protein